MSLMPKKLFSLFLSQGLRSLAVSFFSLFSAFYIYRLNLPLSFSFVFGSGLSLFPLLIAKDEKTG